MTNQAHLNAAKCLQLYVIPISVHSDILALTFNHRHVSQSFFIMFISQEVWKLYRS